MGRCDTFSKQRSLVAQPKVVISQPLRLSGWALSVPPLFTLLQDSFCQTTGRTTLATWYLITHLLSWHPSLLNLGIWGWSQGLELGWDYISGLGYLISSGKPRFHPQHQSRDGGVGGDLEFNTEGISKDKVVNYWNDILRVETLGSRIVTLLFHYSNDQTHKLKSAWPPTHDHMVPEHQSIICKYCLHIHQDATWAV